MRRLATAAAAGLAAFSAAALAAGIGRAVVTTYLPVALSRIHDAPGLIGMVMLVNVAAGLVVPLLVGVWSDAARRRGHTRTVPFIWGGALLTALGLTAVAAGTGAGYLALAACAIVAYTGLNAITTAHRALIAEVYSEERRPAATGAEEMAMLVGTTIGVAAGGLLIEWRTAAPFAAAALAVPLLCVPTVRRMRGREPKPSPARAPARAPVGYYAGIARAPGVRAILTAQALWVLGYAALPAFFILYAERELSLRPSVAGALLVAFGAVSGGAMFLAGRERRQERHLPLLALGVVLMGGGLLAVAPAGTPLEAAPGLACAAAGFGLLSTLGFPVMTTFIPAGEAGAYTAVYFSVRALAGAVALPAAGWTIALTGGYRVMLGAGGVAVLLALVPIAGLASWSPAEPARRARAALRTRRPALGRAAISLAAVTGAVLGAGIVVDRTGLAGVDESLFLALNGLGPGPDALDDAIVGPDFRNYALLAAASVAAALRWRRGEVLRSLGLVALSGVLAFAMVRCIWALWDRARPQEVLQEAAVGAHDWAPFPSFPSGHVAVWLAMALVIGGLFPRSRLPLLALVAAVAVTRIVFGAHFPSDVLAAVVVGWAAARVATWIVPVRDVRAPAGAQLTDAAMMRAESRSRRNELTSRP